MRMRPFYLCCWPPRKAEHKDLCRSTREGEWSPAFWGLPSSATLTGAMTEGTLPEGSDNLSTPAQSGLSELEGTRKEALI